jgi:hypothetical protein
MGRRRFAGRSLNEIELARDDVDVGPDDIRFELEVNVTCFQDRLRFEN